MEVSSSDDNADMDHGLIGELEKLIGETKYYQ